MQSELQTILDNPCVLTILNNMTEYVYIVDEDGYLQFINPAAEKFENLASKDILGKHINDIYTQAESPTLKALQEGKPIPEHENIYMIDGKQYHELAKAIPLYSGEKLLGACTIQRDMTLISQMLSDNAALQKNQREDPKIKKKTFDSLIGEHPAFQRSIEVAKSAATNSSPVLLSGFTGSGKEVFARAIHNASARKNKPFLAINCAAVPDGLLESILFGTTKGTFTGSLDKIGLFEQAEGGTLFLDEINSMSLNAQAKLLRVLEEKEIRRLGGSCDIKINVRIISSINTMPQMALQKRQLREDLFYRLSVTTIMIPPIKDRPHDIALLTEHFMHKFNRIYGKNLQRLSPQVHDFFTSYPWPGNIRQLKHVIESSISSAPQDQTEILMKDMPHYLFETGTATVEAFQQIPPGAPANSVPVKNAAPGFLTSQAASAMPADPAVSPQPQTPAMQSGSQDLFSTQAVSSQQQTLASNPAVQPAQTTPADHLQPENLYAMIEEKEKKQIMDALLQSGGNVSKAARQLGMSRQNLTYRMKKHGIHR